MAGVARSLNIHARDVVRAMHMVSEKAALGSIYNAWPAEPTSTRRVVEFCAKALGMPFEQLRGMAPDRLGQDSRYWLDSSAIYRDVGWKPGIGWADGLAEMASWDRKYLADLHDWPMDYVLSD
jgi:dTDP-glucose 4,6-dehydratase